jgi:hypothetical protein
MLAKLSAGPSAPAHPTSKFTDHSWDTEIKMYAGVIGSAVHTAFRRGLAIAAVHARFNLTNKSEKNAGRYSVTSHGEAWSASSEGITPRS